MSLTTNTRLRGERFITQPSLPTSTHEWFVFLLISWKRAWLKLKFQPELAAGAAGDAVLRGVMMTSYFQTCGINQQNAEDAGLFVNSFFLIQF